MAAISSGVFLLDRLPEYDNALRRSWQFDDRRSRRLSGRLSASMLAAGLIDLALGVLSVVAYLRTPDRPRPPPDVPGPGG
jgi:hypothetical protein